MQAFTAPLLIAATLAAASPALAAPGSPPPAKADTVTSDVRCMLTMIAVSNLNKDHLGAAQFGSHFFLGRIYAREPGIDLAAAVKAQVQTLGPQQLQVELQRCGPIVTAAGKNFQTAMSGLAPPPGAPAPAAPAAAPPK